MKACLNTDKRNVNIEELTIQTLNVEVCRNKDKVKEVVLSVKIKIDQENLDELLNMFEDSAKNNRFKFEAIEYKYGDTLVKPTGGEI